MLDILTFDFTEKCVEISMKQKSQKKTLGIANLVFLKKNIENMRSHVCEYFQKLRAVMTND